MVPAKSGALGTPDGFFDTWRVRSYPSVDLVFKGTQGTLGFRNWTAGCSGTSNFIAHVLRAANIPAEPVGAGGHVIPHFLSDDAYLSHGDDLYANAFTKWLAFVPVKELVIDIATYRSWFGAHLPRSEQDRGVGRQVTELLLTYIPDELIGVYCSDIDRQSDHASGRVYRDVFKLTHTVAELEARGLWTRMDAKLAARGGCSNFP